MLDAVTIDNALTGTRQPFKLRHPPTEGSWKGLKFVNPRVDKRKNFNFKKSLLLNYFAPSVSGKV